MTRKKNGFLTFIFSLLPGAGEMYMGFLKQGISLMALFFAVIAVSSWINIGPILFILPIIWFYGFFHVHNLRSLSDEEFYAVEDKFIFASADLEEVIGKKAGRNIVAIALIVVGAGALWDMFRDMIYPIIATISGEAAIQVDRVLYYIPQFLIAVCIIGFGVYLIKGKKKKMDEENNNEV